MFLEMDQEVFQECQRKFLEDEAKAKGLEEKRENTWKRLEAAGTSLTDNSIIKGSSVPSDTMVSMHTGSGVPPQGQVAVVGN
jgi:serine/threonine-protein phosphatase 2A regulatory subunit B'